MLVVGNISETERWIPCHVFLLVPWFRIFKFNFLVNFFFYQNNAAKKEDLETANKNDSSKKLSVERVYQKKTQLEHILLRPDTYIGSVEPLTQVTTNTC